MTVRKRLSLLFLIDSFTVLFTIFIGFLLIYPLDNPLSQGYLIASSFTMLLAHHLFSWKYGLYRKAWEYASIGELNCIFKAVTWSILVVAAVQLFIRGDVIWRALLITWMVHILLIGGSRLSWRMFRGRLTKTNNSKLKRTLIVGAGEAGSIVVRQLNSNPSYGMKPIMFVDDDLTKRGLEIFGVPVVGETCVIPDSVKEHEIEMIVIAIPSLPKQEMSLLLRMCVDTGVRTQTIPRIEDLMTGKVNVNEIRDVRIEDLLGREEIKLDVEAISHKLTGKIILVTGAGGSIGSEICRQVLNFKPRQLLLLGHGENSIYTIEMELKKKACPETKLVPLIADVQDRARIFEIIKDYQPDVIYHAAAHKHVPLMESNPIEAVKNNIFGTKNVAEAADTYSVSYFVLISTDKAVNPPNIMGATKRVAEMIIQNLAPDSVTKFAAVRFGNVLGSRGSVVPLFKEQIRRGGPVTVTDPEMTRYFMTIPEASRLVLQAGALASGGEVFVLDMGEPVKIVDLAKNLIRLSGYREDEIPINFTGIRPGEKLFEELLNPEEIQDENIYPKIYIGRAVPISKSDLALLLEVLLEMSEDDLRETLLSIANRKKVEIEIRELSITGAGLNYKEA